MSTCWNFSVNVQSFWCPTVSYKINKSPLAARKSLEIPISTANKERFYVKKLKGKLPTNSIWIEKYVFSILLYYFCHTNTFWKFRTTWHTIINDSIMNVCQQFLLNLVVILVILSWLILSEIQTFSKIYANRGGEEALML